MITASRFRYLALGPLFLCAVGSLSEAQDDERMSHADRAAIIAVNAALGGLTAGAARARAGGSFRDGFIRGSAGGGGVFLGKCLIAQQRPLTDWVGRGVAAVGSSIVSNAAAGRGSFGMMALPLGPFRIYRDNRAGRTRVKLDLATALASGYFSLRPNTSFRIETSLRHGFLAFEDSVDWSARQAAGTVLLMPDPVDERVAHELTHIAQYDFMATAWQAPLEQRLLGFVPGGSTIHGYVDLGILLPVWAALNAIIAVQDRPWEKEARSFAAGC